MADENAVAIVKTDIPMGERGIELRTMDDLWRLSQCIFRSGVAPKNMDRPETIMVALQMGAELGMPPMASLQNIAVINNRPCVWGDAQMATVRSKGVFDEEVYEESYTGTFPNDDYTAHCTVGRKGAGKPVTREFSIEDAKRADLWSKAGPWKQYPKRQLMWRARGWALRDAFNDILRGFPSAEEVMDMPAREIKSTVVSSQPTGSKADRLAAKLAEPTAPPDQRVEEAPGPDTPPGDDAPVQESGPAPEPSSPESNEPPFNVLRGVVCGQVSAVKIGKKDYIRIPIDTENGVVVAHYPGAHKKGVQPNAVVTCMDPVKKGDIIVVSSVEPD